MFALDDFASRAAQCAVDVCWRQWRALAGSGLGFGDRSATAIIDPEALVLLSLAVRQHERRLDDQLLWWAESGAALLGAQRTRTLAKDFPARVNSELAQFAAQTVAAGDPRWKVLAAGATPAPTGRAGKGPRELRLLEPSTLMLRLRAGFSVGAKADLLAFLLGTASASAEHRAGATVEVIAKATAWSIAATRRAAREMALARLVVASPERPVRYSVDVPAWARLLRLGDPLRTQRVAEDAAAADVPPWRFWAQVFAFLSACAELGGDTALAQAAPVVQASLLRDLAERFRRALAWNGIEWLDPRQFPGERYGDAFGTTLDAVVEWVDRKA